MLFKKLQKLNIPIAAVIDSNSDPDGITYPIPGNDDSTKAISLFCDLISKAALDGIAQSQNETSVQTETPPKVVKKKASKVKESEVKEINNDETVENVEESLNSDKKSIENGDDIKTSELKKEDVSENLSNDEKIKTESEPAKEQVSKTSEKEVSEKDEK